LLAVGEDLVEVLLDPGRDAKGPGEFYHAIVKSNGVAIFERGVRSDPPLGPAGPWAADAEVAVGRGEGLWTVELAIPLSSFGPRRGASSWGVNFTRYATQGVEASSWTGVRRNFYDPDALGTLLMASPRKPTIEP
jgi:hypothetical protein